MRRALLHLMSESLKVWPEIDWPCLRGSTIQETWGHMSQI